MYSDWPETTYVVKVALHLLSARIQARATTPSMVAGAGDGTQGFTHTRQALSELQSQHGTS